jgi:hypothetical protein
MGYDNSAIALIFIFVINPVIIGSSWTEEMLALFRVWVGQKSSGLGLICERASACQMPNHPSGAVGRAQHKS